MEVCPVGFFCFDKNTFILLIIAIIIVIVYYIHNNSSKFEIDKHKLTERKNEFDELKNELEKTNNNIKELKQETINNETLDSIRINDFKDAQYLVDKDFQRVVNPLVPPERSYPYRINRIGVPINIPTRGVSSGYQQVGALIQNGDDSTKKILPLFGMPTYPGSRQWLYYTGTDNFTSVKLPVENRGKSCQGDYGCEQIMDGDDIDISGYNSKFKVNLYSLDKPIYLPHVL